MSVTQTSKVIVPLSGGVQLNTPVVLLIVAPAGTSPEEPSARLKVSVLAGRSASVALASKVMSVPSSPDWLPIAARTGATLTSLTVTWIVSLSLRVPSLTTTSNV